MSNQEISDYITKQIFVDKNIVTYRLLSRQFSLHVNNAKNELAIYHHNAPYQLQNCSATFLISGTKTKSNIQLDVEDGDDVDMDPTPDSRNEDVKDEMEEDDGDAVPEVHISLVEEKDLEDAKAAYHEIHTILVYCLSPTSLIDPALICDRTESVRQIDREKGSEWSATVGRIVCDGIKKGKRTRPLQTIGGPSTSKPTAPSEPVKRSDSVASEAKMKRESSFPTAAKGKEKAKPIGKFDFFTKQKESKESKKPEDQKKFTTEETVGSKMFFSKPAPSIVSAQSNEIKEPLSGIKRKLSTNSESRDDGVHPEKESSGTRVKGNIILSDDESDEAPLKPSKRRKSTLGYKSEGSPPLDSEAEKEGRALMDIDDDQVERVSHAPSTVVSERESEPECVHVKMEEDEDVDMEDDGVPSKRQPKKRKPKTAVPIGKNGLKKRKITKTRMTIKNGYTQREDYTDWESVDEGEPESKPPPKTKSKGAVKMGGADSKDLSPPAGGEQKDDAGRKKAPPPKAKKTKASVNIKTQKGLRNFFEPKKT